MTHDECSYSEDVLRILCPSDPKSDLPRDPAGGGPILYPDRSSDQTFVGITRSRRSYGRVLITDDVLAPGDKGENSEVKRRLGGLR